MKVLVDTREASRNTTGLGRVARNLRVYLEALADDEHIYHFLPADVLPPEKLTIRKTLLRRASNLVSTLWWKGVIIPRAAAHFHADVIFYMDYIVSAFSRRPAVVLACDTYFFDFPQFDHARAAYYRAFVPFSARKARKIVTISLASKHAIAQRYDVPEEKILVAYPAVSDTFWQPVEEAELAALKRRYELPERFILFVGSVEAGRRNLPGLLSAYALIADDVGLPLVVVGPLNPSSGQVLKTVSALGLTNWVRFTGFVSDDHLRAFYHAADLFVFPSLAEGFGIPVLEAMACGCPVITSNVTSLPEVAGQAAVLIDPRNVGDLAESIRQLVADDGLRIHLHHLGLEQARKFSWEQSAWLIHELLEEVAERQ
jgi:glycosyltransferase involved in cell wall biosynthesis